MLRCDQIENFRHQGFCVAERAIPPDQLAGMREAADALVAASQRGEPIPPAFLREGESWEKSISKTGNRLFFGNRCEAFPALESFAKGPIAAAIGHDLLGDGVYLFNEQMVVKAPRHGDRFDWHQDFGYVKFPHPPYLTLWCALDDATAQNGTIYVLPRDITQDTSVTPHRWADDGANLIGYEGDEAGEIVEVPAGSIIAFSSLTLHRTGANQTDAPRRAYVCQYTAQPMLRPATGRPHNRAIRLGEVVT